MQTISLSAAATQPPSGSAVAPGMTIGQTRRALTVAFRNAGLDSPELDARVLTGHVLGLDHTALATAADRGLNAAEARAIASLMQRRLAREPVARIVGTKEFWGLNFRITPATLVPRPETETVVQAALAAIDIGGSRNRPLQIADLGTGSGALLLALLSELPNAVGIGTDLSIDALATARENAMRLGLSARAAFVACDFGASLIGHFDLVVSNPPYVASADIAALAPEVRCDPPRALDGGIDGLTAYRAITADAQRLINPGGYLVLELGAGQTDSVAKLLQLVGLAPVIARNDLNGIARTLTASVATMTR